MNKITLICSNYNSDKWINEYLEYVNNQIFKVLFFCKIIRDKKSVVTSAI